MVGSIYGKINLNEIRKTSMIEGGFGYSKNEMMTHRVTQVVQ